MAAPGPAIKDIPLYPEEIADPQTSKFCAYFFEAYTVLRAQAARGQAAFNRDVAIGSGFLDMRSLLVAISAEDHARDDIQSQGSHIILKFFDIGRYASGAASAGVTGPVQCPNSKCLSTAGSRATLASMRMPIRNQPGSFVSKGLVEMRAHCVACRQEWMVAEVDNSAKDDGWVIKPACFNFISPNRTLVTRSSQIHRRQKADSFPINYPYIYQQLVDAEIGSASEFDAGQDRGRDTAQNRAPDRGPSRGPSRGRDRRDSGFDEDDNDRVKFRRVPVHKDSGFDESEPEIPHRRAPPSPRRPPQSPRRQYDASWLQPGVGQRPARTPVVVRSKGSSGWANLALAGMTLVAAAAVVSSKPSGKVRGAGRR